MVRDDSLARSLMWLCFGIAVLFLWVQWQSAALKWTLAIGWGGWHPAKAIHRVAARGDTRLIVDLSHRYVYVYRRNQVRTRYPIAVGQRGWETPTGSFLVQQMLQHPIWRHPITGDVVTGSDNPLGDRWIGFWSDGRYQIGFHGTSEERLIGQAISHGCLRMRNEDIKTLYEQVGLGTPVIVRR